MTTFERERSINAPLEAIAARAGVTKGAILYHYKSRQGFLAAIAVDLFSSLFLRVQDKDQPVAEWVQSYLEQMATPAGFVLYAIGDELVMNGELGELDPHPYIEQMLVGRGAKEPVAILGAVLAYAGRRLALGLDSVDQIEIVTRDLRSINLI